MGFLAWTINYQCNTGFSSQGLVLIIRQNARQFTVLEMYVCQIKVYFLRNDQLCFWSNESQLAICFVLNPPVFSGWRKHSRYQPNNRPYHWGYWHFYLNTLLYFWSSNNIIYQSNNTVTFRNPASCHDSWLLSYTLYQIDNYMYLIKTFTICS